LQVADQLEAAVRHVLDEGYRTGDLMSEGMKKIGCSELGRVVEEFLKTS
jgi:3-isopropylmalate dehydrogenase